MKRYNDKRIIGAALIFLMVAGFGLVRWFTERPLSMDLPGEFYFNGAAIALAWTDDNSGENLIIQSDKKQYEGFSSAEVYFSVTNISRKTQEMDMVFWLEDGERVVERVELLDTEQGGAMMLDVNSRAALQKWQPSANRKSVNGFTDGYTAADIIQSGETRYYKALLKYPARANGEFFIEAFGNNGGYGHLDPWYSSSYQYKRAITIDHNQVTTTTNAFPVLATTTADYLKYTGEGGKIANIDAYDLIFVDDDDETLLNFEREKHSTTTGEIAYWIKTDISSTTDKTIYMYYGNASASDLATTTGVWDDNFVMVQHLASDGVATTTYPDFLDSTQYNNDGSSVNMNSDDLVDGQVDGSLDFDGVDDYVDLTGLTLTGGIFTISFLGNLGPINDSGVDYQFDTQTGRFIIERIAGNFQFYDGAHKNYGAGIPYITYNNNWHYYNYVFDTAPATDIAHLYIDGALMGSNATYVSKNIGGSIALMHYYNDEYTTRSVNGIIDEVRISNVARTEQWIATEYNNQSAVGEFLTIGAENCQSVPATRSGEENVKTRIKGGTIFKGGVRF